MIIRVPREKDGLMLSRLLTQTAVDVPQWAVREAIKCRDVRIDGVRITGDVRVCEGQEIRVFWPKRFLRDTQKELPLPQVVFEDEHVIVINKPQGVPSQQEENPLEGDSALTRTIAYLKSHEENTDHVRLCHRLDVQTGGLLLLTKDEASFDAAYEAFSKRTIQKFYTCRVKGCPTKPEQVMRAWLRKDAQLSRVSVTDYPAHGAQEILTGYRVLESGEFARLEVELITGRTHQIRAHLAHVGHPILGDDKYGDRMLNRRLGLRRQQLWATKMCFHATGALAYLDGVCISTDSPF